LNSSPSESQLFDANVVVGPLPRRPPGAPESVPALLETMDRYGLATALVTHASAKWHDPALGNERLIRELSGQDRLIPCWVVLPASCGEVPPEAEQVQDLIASGARAARLCPVAHRLSLEPFEVDRLLGALEERRVPLLLDCDNVHWSEPRPWRFIAWACTTFPALPIILLREGQASFRALFALLDQYTNLVVETSYLQGHDAINLIVQRWGPSRLVFGTGLPLWDPALPITGLTYAGLSPVQREAVGGGTLRRLLEGCRR